MKLVIKLPPRFQYINLEPYIKLKAKIRLQKCELSGNDALTDKRCLAVYKKPLKTLCAELIDNATFIRYNQSVYILVFRNKTLDDIATFITYGSGGYVGSNILNFIFRI